MPHLPPLATAADCIEYGYPELADALLLRASTRVRRYTRQQITLGSSTTVLDGVGPWLMPQRPVVEVVSVTDAAGVDVTYTLVGQQLHSTVCAPLTVIWTHGFDPVPDELVELVCAIGARLATVPAGVAAGARTEQAGGEAVTWGVEAFAGTVDLTTAEKAVLDGFYPRRPRTTVLL